MKKSIYLSIVISLIYILLFSTNSNAIMEDYCAVPTYVVQNIPPNIMIVLDNSGSMFNFAYVDPGADTLFDTPDDVQCTAVGAPCTSFTGRGTYPGVTPQTTDDFKYYGYFNPDYWYTYGTTKFTPTAPKTGSGLLGERAKLAAEWDGNFLNWLLMRRVDIIKKVMIGGAYTGTGTNTRLLGQMPDGAGRGIYKQIANIENYINSSLATGTRCIRSDTGGAGTATFDILTTNSCTSAVDESNIRVDVDVATAGGTYVVPYSGGVQGVLQAVATRARIGLAFYNTNSPGPQGGRIVRDIRGNSPCGGGQSGLACVVQDIRNMTPDSNTPLAETLWTVTGYFAQQATIGGGPGPRYNGGDFTINNTDDPYNYGTGGLPTWPSCAKSYVLYITDGEPCADGNLPDPPIEQYASGRSIFDCSGTNCPAVTATAPETYSFAASAFPGCTEGNNVAGIEDVALWAHTTDLRNLGGTPNIGVNNINGTQNLTTYFVFAFGRGSTLLRYAAINGGFTDDIGDVVGSPGYNIPDKQSEWDSDGNGEPDNFYESTEGYELETAIKNALSNMLSRASSGTAVSVLASGEGSGANLIQGVFYPQRGFGNDVVRWTGSLQNLWYYADPFFGNSSIRENTTVDVPDPILNLTNDNIIQFYFDSTSTVQKTRVRRFVDSNGDGGWNSLSEPQNPAVEFEDVNSLWEAGFELWRRDLTVNPRKLYTTINGMSFLANDFASANASTLAPYLQAANSTEAEYIIRYIHGEDGLVTVDIDDDGTNDYLGVDILGDGVDDYRSRYIRWPNYTDTNKRVWKLGDILNSTPRIASWMKLNAYDEDDPKYGDGSYKEYYITAGYKSRGMVFAGANDGMLHAFKLGQYELPGYNWTGAAASSTEKAKLTDGITSGSRGEERWAFIPKNALPYLKYIADPDYCHIYTVDLTPYLVDASIGGNPSDVRLPNGSSWKTILIGGMKTGGACAGTNVTTSTRPDADGDGNKDFVNTPVDVPGVGDVGFSSYFALDITDPENPEFLWEFSNPQLGFATTGPAVVRVGGFNENGNWFVVFGSGPTGPIDTLNTQFMGRSDQNLRFFVLNLETGSLLRTIDTGIQNAFAGSMVDSTIDPDVNYSDDAIYVGYVRRADTTSTPPTPATFKWTQGGIGRLVTKQSSNTNDWVWRPLMTDIGPVTIATDRLHDRKSKTQWLYFGTGRQYYATGSGIDDPNNRRSLFGITDPCLINSGDYGMFNPACAVTDIRTVGSLRDVTNDPNNTAVDPEGWYINLEIAGNYGSADPAYSECTNYDNNGNCTAYTNRARDYGAEKVITNPLAATTGVAFFTTHKPYNDACALGGKTFLWAVKFDTGAAATGLLRGNVLMQVSTGSIENISLPDAFKDPGGNIGRRSAIAIEGVPSQDAPPVRTTPPPVMRPMHIKER